MDKSEGEREKKGWKKQKGKAGEASRGTFWVGLGSIYIPAPTDLKSK